MIEFAPGPEPVHSPRALVAGHGDFPSGIVSAVGQITGRGDLLIPFSNVGLCRDEIEARMRTRITEHNLRVVFTDLPGGSATIAARRILRDDPTLTLVVGVNLAALIDFVLYDTSISATDAAQHAAEKGRVALSVISGS